MHRSLASLLTFCLAGLASWLAADARAADNDAAPADVFRQQVEPLLVAHCQKCHSGSEPKGDVAFEGLLKRGSAVDDRKVWEQVAEKLHNQEMPPEDEPPMAAADRERVTQWIDGTLARFDCGSERDPGRVTIRRLNRREYDNTIRDLVGVDFHPADDFPSDDVGYGFDNIGDVLSMQPILLEKYLAAAQSIIERALGSEQVNLVTEEVTGGQILEGGARILASESEVRTKLRPFGKGDFIVRVRAYGEQAGNEPARMGLYMDNNLIRTFDVKAVEAKPEVYEAWVPLQGGPHTYSIVFLNDYYDPAANPPQDRNLIISDLEVMGPYPATYKQLIPREHTPEDRQLLTREIIGAFMTRAFRRPATTPEIERVTKLVELAAAQGDNFGASIGLGLEAILVSPHFLFRVELDPQPNNPHAVRTLSDYELVSRLSYFLWSSMPDDELFSHARLGKLRQGDNLADQVKRMLRDPKAHSLVENFAGQWLQLRNLKTAAPDKQVYPQFDEQLRTAMLQETEMFFEAIVQEDRSVLEFLDADYTFVNDRLARHYGLPHVKGNKFRKVQLEGDQRGGVLAQASVLTVTSNPTRTSPVKRGKWVLDNILGTPPPPPPADVPPLAEEASAAEGASLRERMQVHRARSDCAGCHSRMDPLGFGLENYDGIGAWRTEEGKFKIDSSGTLPGGKTFAGPRELKGILKQRQDDFARCLAEKMLTYGLGRGIEYSDKCVLTEITKSMKAADYKFSGLIIAIVTSDPFQKRRGKGSEP